MAGSTKNTDTIEASAVIFDWDDTMVSSAEDQYEALYLAFWQSGYFDEKVLQKKFTLEAFKFYKWHAARKDNLSDIAILIDYMVPDGAFAAKIKRNYESIRETTSLNPTLLPGALKNVQALAEKGIPVGIVSSKIHNTLIEAVKDTELNRHFKLVPLDEFGNPAQACGKMKGPALYVLGSYRNRGMPRKPNPIQYLQMIAAMGALGNGSGVWSIGDIAGHDIKPVQALGCNGIVFGEHFSASDIDKLRGITGYKETPDYGEGMEGLLYAKDHTQLRMLIRAMRKRERSPVASGFRLPDILQAGSDGAVREEGARAALDSAIEHDADDMIRIMQKNELTDIPNLMEQKGKLTAYLDTALKHAGLGLNGLTQAQLFSLAEYIYPVGEGRGPEHVYGAVNAIYEALVRKSGNN